MDFLNKKLSKFFREIKTATLGHLQGLDTENQADVAKKVAMTQELMTLPKYQKIISQLRGASGIVNFVTNNEYPPLIELILKSAFPSSKNEMFSMGMDNLGDQYFVHPTYFGYDPIHSAVGHGNIPPARKRLENLIFGTDAVVNRDWLKNRHNMSDEEIDKILGKKGQEELMAREMARRGRVEQARTLGKEPSPADLKPIEFNERGAIAEEWDRKMQEISEKYDPYINEINKKLFEENQKRLQYKPGVTENIKLLDPKSLNSLKENRNRQLSYKILAIEKLYESIGKNILARNTNLFGGHQKNNDGLLGNKEENKDIEMLMSILSKELSRDEASIGVDKQKYIQQVMSAARNLYMKISEISTNDPKQKVILDQFMAFLSPNSEGGKRETPEDCVNRLKANSRGLFPSFGTKIKGMYEKKGTVLILDDFEKSTLCDKNDKGYSIDQSTAGLLRDFAAANTANMEHNLSSKSKQNKNKVLIILSAEKIQGLPTGSIIEFMELPVEIDEAKIIVNFALSEYSEEYEKTLSRKIRIEIDKQYGQQKGKLKAFNDRLIEEKKQFNLINDDIKKRMISTILGLGLSDAIEACKSAVWSAINREEVEGELEPTISLNEQVLLDHLVTNVNNKLLQQHSLGLSARTTKVSFADYAYEKTSKWADQVKCIKEAHDALQVMRVAIESDEKTLRSLDMQIASQKSSDPMQDKILRGEILHRIVGTQADMSSLAKDIPHVYLLYGAPGVGKSIWAEALADLLKLTIRDVDLGAQKDMWLGNSEKNAIKLFNVMKNARHTLFLIDEIDRQVSQGTNANSASTHETSRDLTARFLEFFENPENENKFQENEIFFVMTSNNVGQIDTALKQRIKASYEVFLPKDPEAYEMFFKSFLDVEQKKNPNRPWLHSDEHVAKVLREKDPENKLSKEALERLTTTADWEFTREYIYGLDWKKIAKAYAGREIDFRTLKTVLQQALGQDSIFRQQLRKVAKGDIPYPKLGLPFTTENMILVSERVATVKTTETTCELGVREISLERNEEIKRIMAPYESGAKKMEEEPNIDPYTQKPIKDSPTKKKIPEEVLKLFNGQTEKYLEAVNSIMSSQTSQMSQETEELDDIEFAEETLPDGRIKKNIIKKPKTTEEQINESPDSLKESLLIDTEEKPEEMSELEKTKEEQKNKIDKKKKTEETIQSSTDYYYNYLLKNGIIKPHNKQAQNVQNAVTTTNTQPNTIPSEQPIKQNGNPKYDHRHPFYDFGFVLIAPATADTPRQYL